MAQVSFTSRLKLALILLCFFLSGAAGLVYQVAWSKALGLVFGNTVYAIATVLAVFMGGLATGSAVLGSWSERRGNPVALYGWIEWGVAASGMLSLAGLAGVRLLYVSGYPLLGGSVPALVALRFVGAAMVLFLPTFLMGGTLPILVRGLTRTSGELGARISRLYWVNTAGAVAGTLAAGFWLLPEMGLRRTVMLAAALNVVAGAIAVAVGRFSNYTADAPAEMAQAGLDQDAPSRTGGSLAKEEPKSAIPVQAPADSFRFQIQDSKQPPAGNPGFRMQDSGGQANSRWLLAAFAVVGATAFVYEVSWTRLLATHLGTSTYAFTVMLAVFLTGIVVGSVAFELWARFGPPVTLGTFATTQTLTAVAALSFLYFHQHFPNLLPLVLRRQGVTFGGLLQAQFVVSTAAMLPAALVFGFNFPLVTMLIAGASSQRTSLKRGRPDPSATLTAGADDTGTAAAVGRAYAGNTVGAIVGAVAAGFWLVPLVGAYRLVALTAMVNVVLAGALALRNSRRATLALATQGVLLGGCILAATGTFYDRALATFGTVVYWDYRDEKLTLAESAATTDVVFAEDGLNASISVTRTEGYQAIRTNGKVDASTRDNITQLLVGHLGPVFHPAPRRVLVIGFGSGNTVSAVARHAEVERIVCVEIEPAVIHAAKYLETLNRGVLRDARLTVVLDDARNYLLTTREQFDVIISEPSNPWIAGVSALFTDEFYREARARLAPGGLFVQWVQAYSLYPTDFRMILATLAPHFAQVSLWRAASSDYLLLAQPQAAQLTLERMRSLWGHAELRADFEELGMRRPEGILGFHRLDDADVRRLYANAPRNTDDRTQLEYNAPRALLAGSLDEENRSMVWKERSQVHPAVVRVEDPVMALVGAAETMHNTESDGEAQWFLDQLAGAPSSVELELVRGHVALEQRRYADARAAFRTALAGDPKSLQAAHGLGELARREIQFDSAALLFRQILGRDPQYRPAIVSMRNVERARANWSGALEWQRRLVELDPTAAELAGLGEILLNTGQQREAAEYFLRALQMDPYTYVAHRNLGEIFLGAKKWNEARLHLEQAARLYPEMDPQIYVSLAEALRGLGRQSDARAALRKGLRLFPNHSELLKATKANP